VSDIDYQSELEAVRSAARAAGLRRQIPALYVDASVSDLHPALLASLRGALVTPGGFYLHGSAGTGKTHAVAAVLMDAVGSDAIAGGVAWANVPRLIEDIRRGFDTAHKPVFRGLDVFDGLLLLDDLGAEKPSDWVRERLYCIINNRYENRLPTGVTSNLGIDQLAGQVGSRVASRLCEMCEVIELMGVDRRKARTK